MQRRLAQTQVKGKVMRSTNLFIVRGHVGADAKGFDGGKVVKVSVATNRIWFERETRERKEAVDWVTLTILNENTAKWALENIKKGDPVYAECRVAERSYQKEGQSVYTTDIIAGVIDRLAPSQQADGE
ncbi:MAG: single-stranded DNA-binding protein [Methylocystis sp.]